MMLKGPDNAPTDTARAQNDTARPSSTDRGIDTGELARVANQALVSRSERSRHHGERRRMGLHIYVRCGAVHSETSWGIRMQRFHVGCGPCLTTAPAPAFAASRPIQVLLDSRHPRQPPSKTENGRLRSDIQSGHGPIAVMPQWLSCRQKKHWFRCCTRTDWDCSTLDLYGPLGRRESDPLPFCSEL
jgi:hypothetical protein